MRQLDLGQANEQRTPEARDPFNTLACNRAEGVVGSVRMVRRRFLKGLACACDVARLRGLGQDTVTAYKAHFKSKEPTAAAGQANMLTLLLGGPRPRNDPGAAMWLPRPIVGRWGATGCRKELAEACWLGHDLGRGLPLGLCPKTCQVTDVVEKDALAFERLRGDCKK